jgi:hypothetical protein
MDEYANLCNATNVLYTILWREAQILVQAEANIVAI